MNEYNHLKIEKKWQNEWEKKKVYQTKNNSKQKKFYVLDMFPYPSGAGLHVGHPRGYIGSDVYARMKRMSGYNVLHPMGYDAFGLPAEQYAIEHKINPEKAVAINVKTFEKQLSIIGLSYDWERRVNTTDPEYYKWTQWIFLQLFDSYYDTKKNKAQPILALVKTFEKSGNKNVSAYTGSVQVFSASDWKHFNELQKQEILMQYRLAYEADTEVNWCQNLGTVLANDEIVNGKDGKMVSERGGHPVEKIKIKQWLMRITAYAERLIDGLEKLDWAPSIKEIQKNWIGKSEGSEIDFKIKDSNEKIKIFTTRADTIFGATYVVLAPEHELVFKLKENILNWNEVLAYIENTKSKEDADRIAEDKEKTGVELKGIKVINPVSNEEIPVWIADYVLSGYGTGAIMAVPAHDERDFEFANKYDLPIKQVVVPEDFFKSIVVAATLENQSEFKKELQDKKIKFTLAISSISKREHIRVEFQKDKLEEFISLVQKRIIGNNWVEILGSQNIIVKKDDIYRDFLKESDEWFKKFKQWEPLIKGQKNLWDMLGKNAFLNELICYQNGGKLINSGKFSEVSSEDARKKITEFVKGKLVTKYKMRDAIFARQRYWGEPIPLYRDTNGILHEVKKLPLTLPKVKSYEPTGKAEGPLAGVSSWVKAGYETNTMPGWAGSSWYFLRYMDPKNKKSLVGDKEIKYWKNVDMYIGGAEHATGHLLYARFWHKFLKDIGIAVTEEPFQTMRNQGMILASDGRKMSKRWGNVINPDDMVKTYGADTLRLYEMFIGPFDQYAAWSTESIIGPRRFLERVWKLQAKIDSKVKSPKEFLNVLHKTILKVTEDIEQMRFNTSVSALMILLSELEKEEKINKEDFKKFLQILAPFAPHITDELWVLLGEKKSIHISSWPKADKKHMKQSEITIAVQINGKVRTELVVVTDIAEEVVKKVVMENEVVKRFLDSKIPKRIIYVKNRLINIVV